MTTPYRDLAAHEPWKRSLERSRRRRALAPSARRETARRKQMSAAMATAVLAGPAAPLAAAQTGDERGAGESPAIELREGGLPLLLGSRGEMVAQVQRALGIRADAVFGTDTDGAVRRFQYAAKLSVDGIVGPETWSALFAKAGSGSGERAAVGGDRVPKAVEHAIERKLDEAGRARGPGRSGGGGAGSLAVDRVTVGDCGSARISAPVRGTVTSNFGPRGGRNHDGIDIAAATGAAVKAAECGTVTVRGRQSGYGNIVCITHTSRFATCYAHLSRFATSRGARVTQGQTIGYVGCTGNCTGPHLHFETRVDGSARDPRPYVAGRSMPGAPREQRSESQTTATASRSSGSTPSAPAGDSSAGTEPIPEPSSTTTSSTPAPNGAGGQQSATADAEPSPTTGEEQSAPTDADPSPVGEAEQPAPADQAPVEAQPLTERRDPPA
jgi:peptidoglycan hydrolase-like protein with peptidoglycan-binding domain